MRPTASTIAGASAPTSSSAPFFPHRRRHIPNTAFRTQRSAHHRRHEFARAPLTATVRFSASRRHAISPDRVRRRHRLASPPASRSIAHPHPCASASTSTTTAPPNRSRDAESNCFVVARQSDSPVGAAGVALTHRVRLLTSHVTRTTPRARAITASSPSRSNATSPNTSDRGRRSLVDRGDASVPSLTARASARVASPRGRGDDENADYGRV